MADLGTLFASLLDESLKAVDDSEKRALMAQVKAIQALDPSKPATLADVLKAWDAGWGPDYFAGDQLDLTAQLAVTDATERTIQVSGGASFQAFNFNASFAETFRQGTQTTLTLALRVIRQSRSKGVEHALTVLGAGLPTLPLPAPATVPGGPAANP